MAEPKMLVEVWSDVVCPFCYLGKHRFMNALEKSPAKDDVEIVWKSFQLNPHVKTDPSISIDQYLAREKGISERRAAALHEHLTETGRQEGLTYRFDKIVVVNTFNAHRFAHLAAARGKQDEAIQRLFTAYFAEGRNVDDPETLIELGKALGIDRDDVMRMLNSDLFADQVRADTEEARQLGIHGVPFFVFDRKYAISGAQAPEVFEGGLQQAYDDWRKAMRSGETIAVQS